MKSHLEFQLTNQLAFKNILSQTGWERGRHTLRSLFADGESKSKSKKDTNSKAKGKKKKKKKGSDQEGLEDSDDGDFEGLEVDYMSDESR